MPTYPETETEARRGRDESYPRGRSGGKPTGALSLRLPGRGEITKGRADKQHPRSAGHCADSMKPAGKADVINL